MGEHAFGHKSTGGPTRFWGPRLLNPNPGFGLRGLGIGNAKAGPAPGFTSLESRIAQCASLLLINEVYEGMRCLMTTSKLAQWSGSSGTKSEKLMEINLFRLQATFKTKLKYFA